MRNRNKEEWIRAITEHLRVYFNREGSREQAFCALRQASIDLGSALGEYDFGDAAEIQSTLTAAIPGDADPERRAAVSALISFSAAQNHARLQRALRWVRRRAALARLCLLAARLEVYKNIYRQRLEDWLNREQFAVLPY